MIGEYMIITGAVGGLGKAFAVECAKRGWNLFITDMNLCMLQILEAGIKNVYPVSVITYACDLTEPDQRQTMYMEIEKSKIKVKGLINVAGLDFEGEFSARSSLQVRTLLRLNIEAAIDNTLAIVNMNDSSLREYKGKIMIINVSSMAAFFNMPYKALYSASKKFLLSVSLALRQELRKRATITVLCPAGMPTNEECIKAIDAQGFFGRITTLNTNDVANLTITKALKGSAIVVPGKINRFICTFAAFVPQNIISTIIRLRWSNAIRKRNEWEVMS